MSIALSNISFTNGVYKTHLISSLPIPVILINTDLNLLYVTLYFFNILDISLSFFNIANTICSEPKYGCFNSNISVLAFDSTFFTSSLNLLNIYTSLYILCI